MDSGSSESSSGAGKGLFIAIGIGGVAGLVCVCVCSLWCLRRRSGLKSYESREEIKCTLSDRSNTNGSVMKSNVTKALTAAQSCAEYIFATIKPKSSLTLKPVLVPTTPVPSNVSTKAFTPADHTEEKSLTSTSSKRAFQKFTYADVYLATNRFSLVLGKGGFGPVYKAVLDDGTEAAVKMQTKKTESGDKEFDTEIQLLSRLRHDKLVNLIGYCKEKGEHILVYEYKSNGSLSQKLHGRKAKRLTAAQRIPWQQRVSILIDVAEGIDYLHNHANPPVIHRDIKSSNILLDGEFNAFIADFGISRDGLKVSVIHGTGGQTTAVKGTPGYLDPEYFYSKKLTKRSDVYSFGVLMAELATGLNPAKRTNEMAVKIRSLNLDDTESIKELADPVFEGNYDMEDMIALLKLSRQCVQQETAQRPWMNEVLDMLKQQFRPSEMAASPVSMTERSRKKEDDERGSVRLSMDHIIAIHQEQERRDRLSVTFDQGWKEGEGEVRGAPSGGGKERRGGDGNHAGDGNDGSGGSLVSSADREVFLTPRLTNNAQNRRNTSFSGVRKLGSVSYGRRKSSSGLKKPLRSSVSAKCFQPSENFHAVMVEEEKEGEREAAALNLRVGGAANDEKLYQSREDDDRREDAPLQPPEARNYDEHDEAKPSRT